jgi:lysophospholipase L1-like esterase
LLVVTAFVLLAAGLLVTSSAAHAQGFVGPKKYYLALGDSLAYGYQPNFDWNHGYAQDFYSNLKGYGSSQLIDMGCPGETTATFINGGCSAKIIDHYYYPGAQLTAAVNFIKAHPGQVSPVTLDIGANDLTPDINTSTCAINPKWSTDLATVQTNLSNILSQLQSALNGTGDLLVMTYYDPYANICPNTIPYVQYPASPSIPNTMNSTIASVAATSGATLVDVFNNVSFGGTTSPNANLCTYTWYITRPPCSSNSLSPDIHPKSQGYTLIAGVFESVYGY